MNNSPLAILWSVCFRLVSVIAVDIGKNSLDQNIIIVRKTLWKGLGLFEHLLKWWKI